MLRRVTGLSPPPVTARAAAAAIATVVLLLVVAAVMSSPRSAERFVLWKGCPDFKVPGWKDMAGKCCGHGNTACDTPVDYSVKPRGMPPLGLIPRYYVGSAYARANNDMITKPGEWETVRNVAGMYVHPVGFRPLQERGADLMARFKNKSFIIEESIGAAFEDRPRHLLDHYFFVMRQGGPEWKCRGIFLYVESRRFYDFDRTLQAYRDFVRPAREMGIPVFLFFMLLDVWNPRNLETMNRTYAGGVPMWVYFAREVGATGVALDYPSWHWLESAAAAWKPEVYRELAVRVFKTCRAAKLLFAWVLNGYCKSLNEVDLVARQLLARGVRPDLWVVDHFHEREHPGTPETQPTVTGQALALIRKKR